MTIGTLLLLKINFSALTLVKVRKANLGLPQETFVYNDSRDDTRSLVYLKRNCSI